MRRLVLICVLLATPGLFAQEDPYASRRHRAQLSAEGGGFRSEAAVQLALGWLARHQEPDGRWSAAFWADHCRGEIACVTSDRDLGQGRYDVGVTGLSLLALAADVQVGHASRYDEATQKAVAWLVLQQGADGAIGYDPEKPQTIYNHAIATYAICDVLGLSGEQSLLEPARQAVAFVLEARNPSLAWKYRPRSGRNDTSVTYWMVQALLAARRAGLSVPDEALAGARKWCLRVTDGYGRAGYETPGGGSAYIPSNDGLYDPQPVSTAASISCRLQLGASRTERDLRMGADVLTASLPKGDRLRDRNFYYWHVGSEALFQYGGRRWRSWQRKLLRTLLPLQEKEDCARGSWPADGEWCLVGGRVYATALNALTLTVFYRNARVD